MLQGNKSVLTSLQLFGDTNNCLQVGTVMDLLGCPFEQS